MATVALLGGVGALAGVVFGTALALVGVHRHWFVAASVVLLLAWLVYVFAEVRGCLQPECGENAYPLALIFGFANFVTLIAVGLVTHLLVRRRRTGRDEHQRA